MTMPRKRIYIAYTGGTIGMQRSPQGFVPVRGFINQCLAELPELQHELMPELVLHEYDPLIDSSDMGPADWQRIADDIGNHYADYDGFVILHGTDTMAFTASALSFMFEALGKPVIVTGSQIPFAELRSDGRNNLLNALYIAANYPVPEVGLFFNNVLYRGNRSTKVHADGFNAFGSPNFPPLLEAGIEIRLRAGALATLSASTLKVHQIIPQPVGVLSLYPGISPGVIGNALQAPVKALILQTYGVGNAPQNKELLDQLARASARGVVVVNCTQCQQGRVNMAGYATGHALQQAGVISGFDMTTEAALTKLHFLFSQGLQPGEVRQLMQQDLRGELTH